ncbi:unnamed protein product [Discosporangium mesarthrocarpum]
MFDCHAHLTDSSLQGDLAHLLTEAELTGVQGIVVVSEDVYDCSKVLELCRHTNSDPNRVLRLHPSIGMHPEKANIEDLEEVLHLIDRHSESLACVGEIGLDYSRHVVGEGEGAERKKDIQREVLAQQARKAEDLGLAVNVHSRSAGHHAISLLREVGVTRAVLHAFDGKPKYAMEAAAAAGYFFSVPPIVCRSPGFQKLVKSLPLESLLLETDAPALAPEKNTRNEPRSLAISCQWVADLKGVPLEVVQEVTTQNARALFPAAFGGEDSKSGKADTA